jgi:bifunctional DNA-binding transcriptional regulator/antitoxin component of YhaV-PrlF toxin-antitoxin module
MKKNSGDIFESIEIDPITGQYYITIPEQIMNELEWYEDTEICFTLDGGEVVLSERESD